MQTEMVFIKILFSLLMQASQATVTNIWQTNPGNALPAPGWPTEAWSGLDLYRNTLIPGWKNSLVAGSLKWGRLLRMRLDATGAATAPTNSLVTPLVILIVKTVLETWLFLPMVKIFL
jgi:hypothetical protein